MCYSNSNTITNNTMNAGFKSDSDLPKKINLFSSMKALQECRKKFLFHFKSLFRSEDT